MQAARTLFDAAAPLLAKRGATKEQRREDFMHLRTHWLETAAIAPFTSFIYLPRLSYDLLIRHGVPR